MALRAPWEESNLRITPSRCPFGRNLYRLLRLLPPGTHRFTCQLFGRETLVFRGRISGPPAR
jgi:hypothetical protein